MTRPPALTLVLFSLASVCATLAANATASTNEVHKCATPTGILYQGLPCNGADLPTPAVTEAAGQAPPASAPVKTAVIEDSRGAASDESARGAPACAASPLQPRRLPWRQATICIGMTDDEVLNLPGWGRPARMARTQLPREWREEWTYDARLAGPRQLHFVNGRLAVVDRSFVEFPAGATTRLVDATDSSRAATN